MEEVLLREKCMACERFCDRRAPGKVICLSCTQKLEQIKRSNQTASGAATAERPMGVDEFAKNAGRRLLLSDFPEKLRPYVEARVRQTLVKDGKWFIHISLVKTGVESAGNYSREANPCSR
jgi:hypothetical protein